MQMDPDRYEYYPETVSTDHYKSDEYQRVAVYARVSTDDVRQTSSFELQKRYYEDFVARHAKWELVEIYADEGISGTSTAHRDAFNRMIADAKAGKIDLIITKSVSRFARNVEHFLQAVHSLADHNPRIGVFFESENIYSLKEDSQMMLSFQATMAEEESRNKSRSMETSLRMRLDHGLPLTPKLLGFTHDEEGKLIRNPDTWRIPKLMFCMCLFGYSTSQIASKLILLGKQSYKGNVKWTSGSVLSTLRNERYCGDVFTRKTFTPDVISHRSIKNRGERPRTMYRDEHEAIVTRDDFIAVQHILNNSKYGNKAILPELSVIMDGLLKGYVVINPRWAGFKEADYLRASASAYRSPPAEAQPSTYEVQAGDFDLRGFEIARMDFFDDRRLPFLSIESASMKFSTECLRRMQADLYVEMLIHPTERKIAIRPASKDNRNSILWAKVEAGQKVPRVIAGTAYLSTVFSLFGWKPEYKYRMNGILYRNDDENALVFTAQDAGILIREQAATLSDNELSCNAPVYRAGKRIGAVPASLTQSFGQDFYLESTLSELANQTREQWKIRIDGQLFSSGHRLNITPYDELKAFIQKELGDLFWEDDLDEHLT
ncbi:MAG: recombinase family protein [Lachnospiraceae bacterium]|nr:recombinase family protein [Lachnospiraceae bacterium]